MDSKLFLRKILLRVVFLIITCLLFSSSIFIFIEKKLVFIPIILILFIAFQIFELVSTTKKQNKELAKFLDAIKFSDSTIHFPENSKKKEQEKLFRRFNEVIAKIEESKAEKEAKQSYIEAIVKNLNTAILSYNSKGKIILINKEFKCIAELQELPNIQMLKQHNLGLFMCIKDLIEGKSATYTLKNNIDYSIQKSRFKLLNDELTIIVMHNIEQELDQKEIEAWLNLIKVLRHEILNSVTPISSLSETLIEIMQKNGSVKSKENISDEDIKDIFHSIKSIKVRSDGLYNFVNLYRSFTKLPEPQFEKTYLKELICSVLELLDTELKKRGIDIVFEPTETIIIKADPKLCEQVFINLLKNSIDALENSKTPLIEITLKAVGNSIYIEIRDNGCGISKEKLKDVFTPFYSTKEHGSGIGLTLARQILHMHHASINIESNTDKGTKVQIII